MADDYTANDHKKPLIDGEVRKRELTFNRNSYCFTVVRLGLRTGAARAVLDHALLFDLLVRHLDDLLGRLLYGLRLFSFHRLLGDLFGRLLDWRFLDRLLFDRLFKGGE